MTNSPGHDQRRRATLKQARADTERSLIGLIPGDSPPGRIHR